MAEHSDNKYRNIYLVLLGLLVISVVGPFLGILWVTLLTAFGIAVVKANLVVQNFMHLKEERHIMKWMLASSVVLMFLLFAGVAADVMRHEGANWVNTAAIAATEHPIGEPAHGGEGGHEEPDLTLYDEGEDAAGVGGFDAATAYTATCASCHGATGGGDGPGAAALEPRPANFRDPAFWSARDEDRLVTAILQGGGAVGASAMMPPWGAVYDDEQARALVAYMRDNFAPGN